MSHWSSKYVGVPYVVGGRDIGGLDCWGLLKLVYEQEFGVNLPAYTTLDVESAAQVCATVDEGAEDWLEIQKPVDGCAVAMSKRKAIHHVGVFTNSDGGKILHSWDRKSVVADTVRGLWLRGFKIVKFYKHHGIHT
jgi:probable lipoprotein NlpC